jgi:hypothetical protein
MTVAGSTGSSQPKRRKSSQLRATGSFAAADLGAEALGHDAVVAFEGGGGEQRLTGGNDAIPAGAGDSDYQIFTHAINNLLMLQVFRSPSIGKI